MKYDIYFHNDFDGRASAAVLVSFLRGRGDDVEHLTPIDFYLQKQWLDRDFFKNHKLFNGKRSPVIIVDFFYHPAAAWWFDHHSTTFKKPEWKKAFKADKQHVLKPEYHSCCHLVYASLVKNFGWKAPKVIKQLVAIADVVDGAQHKTPRKTIYLEGPETQIEAYVDDSYSSMKAAAWMVNLLAAKPVADIVKMPAIKKTLTTLRAKNIKALAFYKKNMKVFPNVTFIDLTRSRVETLRFASYHLYPKIQFAIRATIKNGNYHVGIGANPWMKKNHLDLGQFLSRYGGGGHPGAAATDIPAEKAKKAIPEMIKQLSEMKKA